MQPDPLKCNRMGINVPQGILAILGVHLYIGISGSIRIPFCRLKVSLIPLQQKTKNTHIFSVQ